MQTSAQDERDQRQDGCGDQPPPHVTASRIPCHATQSWTSAAVVDGASIDLAETQHIRQRLRGRLIVRTLLRPTAISRPQPGQYHLDGHAPICH